MINKKKLIEMMQDLIDFNISKKRTELWEDMSSVNENINNNIFYKYHIFAYIIDISKKNYQIILMGCCQNYYLT
jgi:hypothetical protein